MKKKTVLYILAFLGVIFGIVFLIIRFGAGAQFITVFKASGFNQAPEIGAVVERRLFLEVRKSTAVLFGIQESDPNQISVVNGFIEVFNSRNDSQQAVIIYDKDFLAIAKQKNNELQFSFSEEMDALVLKINELIKNKKKPILITRAHYSSHLMHRGLMSQLEVALKDKVLSFTLLKIVLSQDQEVNLLIPCIGSHEAGATFGQLGCMVITKSRGLYQMRKPIPEKYISVLEQSGENDFLLFIGEKN